MYDGVQATSYFAAIYYVTCFIIGNYIVLNLFIAVLLNNNAITDVCCQGWEQVKGRAGSPG